MGEENAHHGILGLRLGEGALSVRLETTNEDVLRPGPRSVRLCGALGLCAVWKGAENGI